VDFSGSSGHIVHHQKGIPAGTARRPSTSSRGVSRPSGGSQCGCRMLADFLRYAKRVYKKTARRRAATPSKNYITPGGLQRLKDEHRFLLTRERPAVTEVVA
jgi:hypothetical protein